MKRFAVFIFGLLCASPLHAVSKPASGTPIDFSNALSTGIISAYLFGEGSGSITTDATGRGRTGTLDASVTWTTNSEGAVLAFSDENELSPIAINNPVTLSAADNWTMAFNAKTTVDGLPGMVVGDNAVTTTFVWLRGGTAFQIRTTSNFDMQFTGGGTSFTSTANWVVTHAAGSTALRVYKNGAEVSDSPIDSALSTHDFKMAVLGNGYNAGGFALVGQMQYFVAWSSRALTAAEVATFNSNVWQIYSTTGVVVSSAITVTSPTNFQLFQRTSKSTGSIYINGTYTGTPSAIEAGWGGQPFKTLTSTMAGGTYSGILSSCPVGSGPLIVRFANDTGVASTIAVVSIGDAYALMGQSNSSGRGVLNQAYTGTPSSCSIFGNDYVWRGSTDPVDTSTGQVDSVSADTNPSAGGSIWPLVFSMLESSKQVPIAGIPCAKGGLGIIDWQAAADHLDRATLYGSCNYRVQNAGTHGIKAALFWGMETDAMNGMSTPTASAYILALSTNVRADMGCPMMFTTLQVATVYTSTNQAEINLAITSVTARGTISGGIVNISTGPRIEDISHDGDGVHITANATLMEVARRWYDALKNAFYKYPMRVMGSSE